MKIFPLTFALMLMSYFTLTAQDSTQVEQAPLITLEVNTSKIVNFGYDSGTTQIGAYFNFEKEDSGFEVGGGIGTESWYLIGFIKPWIFRPGKRLGADFSVAIGPAFAVYSPWENPIDNGTLEFGAQISSVFVWEKSVLVLQTRAGVHTPLSMDNAGISGFAGYAYGQYQHWFTPKWGLHIWSAYYTYGNPLFVGIGGIKSF